MKLNEIFSGLGELAWARFSYVFQSITDRENINCYYYSNTNTLYINNVVLFRVFQSFVTALCTSS